MAESSDLDIANMANTTEDDQVHIKRQSSRLLSRHSQPPPKLVNVEDSSNESSHDMQTNKTGKSSLAAEKRLVTNTISKLSKLDNLVEIMGKSEAWQALSPEAQARLYAMLPPPPAGETIDPDQHPLHGPHADVVEHYMKKWQLGLAAGYENKKIRSFHWKSSDAADKPEAAKAE